MATPRGAGNCPSREQLSAYSLGKLSDEWLEQISRHVETCSTCDDTIAGLKEDDSLVIGLRSQQSAENWLDGAPIQRALEKLLARDFESPQIETVESVQRIPAAHPVQVRDYRILDKLGEGGMGAVYRALHTRLDREVALKILPIERMRDQRAVDRFVREMKAVGKLDHPNIVRALDAGEDQGVHYLVMELIDGTDLSRLVKERGALPIVEACTIVHQAALGLEHAHRAGLIHRDIKPSNLVLTRDGKVKVLDLGLALLQSQFGPANDLTTSGQMMGTLDYMAPEQGSDSHKVDIRADIYSLGATLYKLLTGESPFSGPKYDTPLKKMMALASESVAPIVSKRQDLPADLVAIVHRMLQRDPNQRFATPADAAAALERFTAGADLAAWYAGRVAANPRLAASSNANALARPVPLVQHPALGQAPPGPVIAPPVIVKSAATIGRRGQVASKGVARSANPDTWAIRLGQNRRLITISAASLVGSILLAIVTLYFVGRHGTIVVEIDDPEGLIQVTVEGEEILITEKESDRGRGKASEPIKLLPGEHTLHVKRGDLEFDSDKFKLRRRDNVVVAVKLAAGRVEVVRQDGPQPIALGGKPLPPPIAPISPTKPSDTITTSIGMQLKLIPAGEFDMGQLEGEPDERPSHRVRISRDYYLGINEVTQAQYQALTYKNPSNFRGDDLPVENVSSVEANEFCRLLTEKESSAGQLPAGMVYRLPTEAQWEYAARAGTKTNWICGDDEQKLGQHAWYDANSESKTHPVGQKQANAWGLHDMAGNVWEWVLDEFQNYPGTSASVEIDPWVNGFGASQRVYRGGGWIEPPRYCRSALRNARIPSHSSNGLGFRVALVFGSSYGGIADARGVVATPSDGWTELFNGRDLAGWAGATDKFDVKDGCIACKPGVRDTLYTKDEYSDFVVRLEFKLPPGGNDGLAIRYPGNGDPAYTGMCELQVLDDSANAGLDPRRYHGSAYGLVAAKVGYQRPVGQWNTQEVTVRGSTIKVVLNGNVILDTDLKDVSESMGNRTHPGKDRTSGHFGFFGFGYPVQYRNIRIMRLKE